MYSKDMRAGVCILVKDVVFNLHVTLNFDRDECGGLCQTFRAIEPERGLVVCVSV